MERRPMHRILGRSPGRITEFLTDQSDEFGDHTRPTGYQLLAHPPADFYARSGNLFEDGGEFF
jgi:hypothetical protein